jgi:hypothetical protein
MPWWFIPTLILVIAVSAAAGLLIVYIILRIQKKPWPFSKKAISTATNRPSAEVGVISGPESISRSPIILELEKNIEIATAPVPEVLVKFQLEIWNTHRRDYEKFNSAILGELTRAYVDMLLANNMVWMLSEFGSTNQNSLDDYLSLRTKVAERLQRIMPEVKQKLGVNI